MKSEKELHKLVNVLLQTARTAFQSEWTGAGSNDAAELCVDRHNRILARLKELEPEISAIFEPLAAGSSLATAAIACRQLASYFEDDIRWSSRFKSAYAAACDPKPYKEFWRKSAKEVQDLGEFMRACADEWTRRRKAKAEGESSENPPNPPA
jgi:hypothetical protein